MKWAQLSEENTLILHWQVAGEEMALIVPIWREWVDSVFESGSRAPDIRCSSLLGGLQNLTDSFHPMAHSSLSASAKRRGSTISAVIGLRHRRATNRRAQQENLLQWLAHAKKRPAALATTNRPSSEKMNNNARQQMRLAGGPEAWEFTNRLSCTGSNFKN